MGKLALHWKIIIGLILGIIYSLVASYLGWNQFTKDWIAPFGDIFIRMLKFIAVPLVLFSIISGIAGLQNLDALGRLGIKTIGAYLVTTVTAVGLGLLLVNLVKPGHFIKEDQLINNRLKYEIWVSQTEGVSIADGKDYLHNPAYQDRVTVATAELQSDLEKFAQNADLSDKMSKANAYKNSGPLQFLVDFVPENIFLSLTDGKLMLQVIFFAIFFGIILASIPKDLAGPVIALVEGTNAVFLRMVEVIMAGAPYFVFALMAGVLAKMANSPAEVLDIFKSLAVYSLVVFTGLVTMVFVVYPILLKLTVRGFSYTRFFRKISPAQFLAFSTSSSAATLPVTLECTRDNVGVDEKVANFVLPIGATVNMDGTSLYLGVAVIFAAQFHLVDLSFSQQLTVALTATLASIGAAAVPSAGLVMVVVILQSVGLNPAWLALIVPVDRILDMCRTVVNVTSDMTVSTIIAQSEGELHEELWRA